MKIVSRFVKWLKPKHQMKILRQWSDDQKDDPKNYGDVGTGFGTVVDRDGLFAERQAAMENKYFREKTAADLKKLRQELRQRQEKKQKHFEQGDEVKDDAADK